MKKLLIRFLTILIYLVALLWLSELKLWVLLDLKTILIVIFGTVLLTVTSFKKGMPVENLKTAAGWNAMLTSYLATFFLLFSRLSGSQNTDQHTSNIYKKLNIKNREQLKQYIKDR